jgi:hypothetical protein
MAAFNVRFPDNLDLVVIQGEQSYAVTTGGAVRAGYLPRAEHLVTG